MKKLSILLIGLLLVSGLAFAEMGDVSVSGSASVTFGVDLNTTQVGFANAGTSSVSITIIDEASASAGGDDGMYGEITIADYDLSIKDGAIVSDIGSVTAAIVIDPITITIYTAPEFSLDYAGTIDSGTVEGDVSTAIVDVNGTSVNGITISIPAGPAGIDIKLASDGDWTENVDNDFAFGTDISLDVMPATVSLGFMYGWITNATVIGVSAGVDLAVGPADIYLDFDGDASTSGAFAFDIAAGATVAVSSTGMDDETEIALATYIFTGGTVIDLDVTLGVTEPTSGGLVDMLGASVTVELLDVAATLEWNIDVTGEYDTGTLKPYFGFGTGTDTILDLNVGVVLSAGLTGLDNTTITLDYVSADLATDNGIITVVAEVAL